MEKNKVNTAAKKTAKKNKNNSKKPIKQGIKAKRAQTRGYDYKNNRPSGHYRKSIFRALHDKLSGRVSRKRIGNACTFFIQKRKVSAKER